MHDQGINMADSINFLRFNTFAKPVVNKFVKARPTQSLGDVVEMHYDLTSPDWELVSIQVSKTFCETEEVNKIRCEPTMPAGVVYDMGMCYLYGDFRLKK